MMLGHPIAGETQPLGMGGQIGSIGQRLRDAAALNDGDEIEEGEFCNSRKMASA